MTMTHLLLIEDVDDLGRSGDIVSVKPGYARNFLLPQGKAVFADKNALRMQIRLQAKRAQQAAIDKEKSVAVAAMIDGKFFATPVKVDSDGNMYGSVSVLDILKILEDNGITIDRRSVQLPHALKETGTHEINLKLKEGVPAKFRLKIAAEGTSLEDEPVVVTKEEAQVVTEETVSEDN
jgi:large subunit ribosomal protein L9